MSASGAPDERAGWVAIEAIRRTWPMASTETVARLVHASSVVEKANGTLMAEGEHPSRVAVVLSGTVVATWGARDGRIVHVGLFGPGQFIGMPTLIGGLLPSGIDALTKVSILTWPSRAFRAITDVDLALSLDLLDRAVHAIQLVTHLVKVRTFTTAASRLAGLLLQYEALCFSRDARWWRAGSCPPWRASRRGW